MKPIIEARAKTAMLEGKNQHSSPSEISREALPIRTDEAVANLASISSNTIRKIEQIEQQAAPARTKQQKKQRQRQRTKANVAVNSPVLHIQ